MWDSFRGLGKTAPYFAPVIAGTLAGMATFGLNAATAERCLHAMYLLTAGLGMVAVLRLFRPKVGLEHVLAALVYMFSPYTAQFLLPSGLFLHYAIAPWLLVALAKGLREGSRRSWRWPAAFALCRVRGGLAQPAEPRLRLLSVGAVDDLRGGRGTVGTMA